MRMKNQKSKIKNQKSKIKKCEGASGGLSEGREAIEGEGRVPYGRKGRRLEHSHTSDPVTPDSALILKRCHAEAFSITQAWPFGICIGVATYFEVRTMSSFDSCNVPHHTPYRSAAVAYKIDLMTT